MEIISLLNETKIETEKYFDLPFIELTKTYKKGKWDIKKILVHLADAESVLCERIKRIIAEPKKVVWAFDQDLWCENLNYENFPLELSKAQFISNRQTILFLANKYYNDLGHKKFVHNEAGTRTLKDEFDKVVLHNQGHNIQIKKALLIK